MEACGTAHFWGRQRAGPRASRRAAAAARGAALRAAQQDRSRRRQGPARSRSQREHPSRAGEVRRPSRRSPRCIACARAWLATRTARLNTVRGLLREFGIVIPARRAPRRPAVARPARGRRRTAARGAAPRAAEAARRDRRARAPPARGRAPARRARRASTPAVAALRTIPGVGLLTATALVAFVGDAQRFPSGAPLRQLPRPHAARALQRAAPPPRRDQQARRSLPAHAAHPRRSLRALPRQARQRRPRSPAHWALAARSARAATTRPPSRWPTSSRASPGPCGRTGTELHASTPPAVNAHDYAPA